MTIIGNASMPQRGRSHAWSGIACGGGDGRAGGRDRHGHGADGGHGGRARQARRPSRSKQSPRSRCGSHRTAARPPNWFPPIAWCRAMRSSTPWKSATPAARRVRAPSVVYPIPEHMRYVADSAIGPGAEVSYSIDGGRSFDQPENLKVAGPAGAPRPADGGRLHPYPLAVQARPQGQIGGIRAVSRGSEIVGTKTS